MAFSQPLLAPSRSDDALAVAIRVTTYDEFRSAVSLGKPGARGVDAEDLPMVGKRSLRDFFAVDSAELA